jgi:hypothetical protein
MQITRRGFFAAPAAAAALAGQSANAPARLARKDCFFGMHFDLHPNNRDAALGRDVSEEMVERFMAAVKPDFVQYDYKGHVGYIGYPSTVSPAAPTVADSLAVWRKVTARHGTGLFIHFSGVWDSLAILQHPEWAVVHADGSLDSNATSTFSPYVDERMIPQLKEAVKKYDLDGAWVDGECWALRPDYSPAAARAFREATGIETLPRGPNEKGWQQFLDFTRENFRKYVRHYCDELHRFRPSFQIASNWLYTTYVPERPELPVDYISGDYLGNASISAARLDARYLSSVGKPWDLMAWGFQRATQSRVGLSHKPAVQLQQEAAVVMAQGGGFQIYYQPTRAGKVDDRHIQVMSKVAGFCRARQKVSHKTESVPQIGVVFSTHSLYATGNKLFGGWGAAVDPARGMIDALVESHHSVDVVPEWKLAEVAARYPLLVLPDWPSSGEGIKRDLTAYVRNGGNLLIAGAENAALFADLLGVRFPKTAARVAAYVPGEEVFGNIEGIWQDVELAGAQSIEQRYPTYDSTRDAQCAATLSTLGSGRIIAAYGPLGRVFAAAHAPGTRQFLERLVRRVYQPMVECEGPPTVEVALRRKEGKLLVHLLNFCGMQVAGDYAVMDFVPSVGPLKLRIRTPRRPAAVTLLPEGRAVNGEWRDGVWTGTVDKLDIHSVVAL